MIKKTLMLLLFPVLVQAQGAGSLSVLFDSLKTHPQAIADQLNMEKALAGKQLAYGKLYPSINVFGTYNYASTPTGMIPIAPNDLLAMVKDQTVPQPFSEDIFRLGVSATMPVFIKSIYTMAAKAKMMYKSAEAKKYINLLKNETMIVSLIANLQYMDALDTALEKKEKSLQKTREIILIKVNNERAPGSALLKIDDGLNQINIMRNDISLKHTQVISMIQSLTGITLNSPVDMTQIGTYQNGELKALDPLRKKIEADKLGLRAEKEKLWPVLMLKGNYRVNSAMAYNNNQHVDNNFGTFGVAVKMPIFAKDQYAQIHKTRLDVESSENELDKMNLELSSQADQLQTSLQLINNKIELYTNSIKNKTELLAIAKVSYESDRMTIEDYLKYEDDLVMEQSKLFKSQAERWQTLMKLAVIYGNDIENIIK